MLASSIPGRGAARAKELLPGAENILKFVEFLVGCRHRRTSRRRPRNLRRAAAAAAPSRHHERAGERERKRATGVNEEEKKVLKAGPVGYKFALGGACRPGGCCWFGLMQAAVLAQTLGPVWWEAWAICFAKLRVPFTRTPLGRHRANPRTWNGGRKDLPVRR